MCLDGCKDIFLRDYVYESDYSMRAECLNKCNQYVGDTLDKLVTILNSTVEKMEWGSK
jgi:hypothetical protein